MEIGINSTVIGRLLVVNTSSKMEVVPFFGYFGF